jgi:D-aspartate ligase
MHASRDIIAASQEISHGTLTVPEYLASFRRKLSFASFALDDPLPAIVEPPIAAARYIAHKRAKHYASLLKSSSTVR